MAFRIFETPRETIQPKFASEYMSESFQNKFTERISIAWKKQIYVKNKQQSFASYFLRWWNNTDWSRQIVYNAIPWFNLLNHR